MNMLQRLICCVFVLAVSLYMAACSDQVAAPDPVDQPYSMYGILNPRLPAQTLLVSPIEPLLSDLPEEIDAQVRSTDLGTGDSVVWTDSTVRGARGQIDHVFVGDFRARFGAKYRIEVERSDGMTSSAVVQMPSEVRIDQRNVALRSFDVIVLGESFHILDAEVTYTVRWYDKLTAETDPAAFCNNVKDIYSVPHSQNIVPIEGGYRFSVNLNLDHESVVGRYQSDYGPLTYIPSVAGVALMNLKVRLLIADPDWKPPGGTFDADVLSNPDVMSNVTNGYGFVGGGYNEEGSVFPGEDVVANTRFFDFLMRPPSRCTDYCNCG